MDIDGKRLRRRREQLGLTQQALAEACGLSQETISRLESGKARGRMADTQQRLAAALGTTPEYLCGRSDEAGPPTAPALAPPGAAAAGAGAVHFVPDAAPPVRIDDPVSPLEAALAEAFDKARHTLRDVDAVRLALRNHHQRQATGVDLIEAARIWLDAAADLRRGGETVTLEALLVRVTLGRYSAHGRRDAREQEEAMNAEARARARALGLELPEDEPRPRRRR